MRILVGWDDPTQAELLPLYLGLGNNHVEVAADAVGFERLAHDQPWDAALLALTITPSLDACYEMFCRVRLAKPDLPILLGLHLHAMISLPRFLKMGLRSYIPRDERGDFIFLILANLESTVAALHAERAGMLADKLREELDGVRKLQESIIPRDIPALHGYRTVARYEPSEVRIEGGRPVVMAGGDYYEVFPVADTTLVALVGDASGHGLKACMSIITMHTLLRLTTSGQFHDTAPFVEQINQRLCDHAIIQSEGGFITMFYVAINVRDHTMNWTGAGHPMAMIHDREANEVYPVGTHLDGGLPLGVTTDMGYQSLTCEIPPGARILIYSDGLTDALVPDGQTFAQFGTEGIVKSLLRSRDGTLEEAMHSLFDDSRAFAGGHGRHDDTSVVMIERLPDNP